MQLSLSKTRFADASVPPPPPQKLSRRRFRGCIALVAALVFAASNAAFAQFNPITFTATQTTVTLDWSASPNGMAGNILPFVYRRAGPAVGTACPAGSNPETDSDEYVQIYNGVDASGPVTNITIYTDTGLTAATRYCYRVTANFGQQASDAVDVTTAAEPRPVASVAAAMLRVTPGTAVTLTGSGTGQSPITNYEWECAVNSPTGVTGIAAPTLASGDDATPAATFTAQMLVDANGMPFMNNGEPVTQIVLHCDLVVTNGGGESENMVRTVVTIANRGGDDAATNDAILPNVLRNLERNMHNGIFNRIQQRQQQDGKWQ